MALTTISHILRYGAGVEKVYLVNGGRGKIVRFTSNGFQKKKKRSNETISENEEGAR